MADINEGWVDIQNFESGELVKGEGSLMFTKGSTIYQVTGKLQVQRNMTASNNFSGAFRFIFEQAKVKPFYPNSFLIIPFATFTSVQKKKIESKNKPGKYGFRVVVLLDANSADISRIQVVAGEKNEALIEVVKYMNNEIKKVLANGGPSW